MGYNKKTTSCERTGTISKGGRLEDMEGRWKTTSLEAGPVRETDPRRTIIWETDEGPATGKHTPAR